METNKKGKMKIEEIQQVGVYSGMRGRELYNSIKYLKEKELISRRDDSIDEVIDYEFDKEKKGGIIIFATDINSVKQSENKIANWIKQKLKTLEKRVKSNKKINKAEKDSGSEAWTVGYYLDGRYTSPHTGKSFSEKSLSLEVIGITSQQLQSIAEDICGSFYQETVLVKDYIKGKIYLVNADKTFILNENI